MRELSLFTGAGGGILGSKLLGWTTIGYVENNDYRQRIIARRIADGILDAEPIFGDIRAFIREGYAASYQGMVDVITAGFPCQPFSVAGKRLAENDPSNMWPETIETIRIVRPRYVFLENVPGLLSKSYIRRILGDLAEIFPYIRGGCLSACTVGAPHQRTRLWIAADSEQRRCTCNSREEATSDTNGQRCEEQCGSEPIQSEDAIFGRCGWWAVEPLLGRVAHGVANRVDRLEATGLGQVPAVVATAWKILNATGDI